MMASTALDTGCTGPRSKSRRKPAAANKGVAKNPKIGSKSDQQQAETAAEAALHAAHAAIAAAEGLVEGPHQAPVHGAACEPVQLAHDAMAASSPATLDGAMSAAAAASQRPADGNHNSKATQGVMAVSGSGTELARAAANHTGVCDMNSGKCSNQSVSKHLPITFLLCLS